MKMRPIMFVGTGSDVGKSIITAGFCRILLQDGYRPAPFKAQNMSLNSFATKDGLEIGRAQAVQAEACSIECDTRMNPVLLKPTSLTGSQVILHGKPIGNQSAKEYFLGNNKENLFGEAKIAFDALEKEYFPVVMEGAGSISELNLKHRDIVNLRMAAHANACVYLVADIDKGGVFGSVYGTIALLEEWERALIKGIIINKFRGDISLFDSGRTKLEELTGIPVVGVVPYAKDIYIEEEDSVALNTKKVSAGSFSNKISIAVILLPHLSNYTDFNLLERDERVNLYYTKDPLEIAKAAIVILPGTKNTLSDLHFLRKEGLAQAILNSYENGNKVIGICGGYQMMGELVEDPYEVESSFTVLPGLGLLPIKTIMTKEKVTVQREFLFKENKAVCKGYEIHMGESKTVESAPLLHTIDGKPEGYLLNNNCWGTYVHGILDNQLVIDDLLGSFSIKRVETYQEFKEKNFDALATILRASLDIEYMYSQSNLNND
ncbi:cobyric acid synthase [Flavobacterium sp. 7A]|uniref:cobyric acid synthase n=1 Tax=Flavobacterium sp. 7A TaxID=2940571 RepID=UPI00222809E7|nr:cobyric acid synthase [Flavobacterium sp. 7A]MCW2119668.1 adenosylcobyric acid synthase [Flavobacterium sp. 7A]